MEAASRVPCTTPPGRPRSGRRRLFRKRILFPSERPVLWSKEENIALVQFVLRNGGPHAWPSASAQQPSNIHFWESAAEFVKIKSNSLVKRSAQACQIRVFLKLSKKYPSPQAAANDLCDQPENSMEADSAPFNTNPEISMDIDTSVGTDDNDASSAHTSMETESPLNENSVENVPLSEVPLENAVPFEANAPHPMETDVSYVAQFPMANLSSTNNLLQEILLLPEEEQLKTFSSIFSQFADIKCNVRIPSDFLELVISASQHLLQCDRSNVVYGIANAIGRKRPDGSDSRLPAKRMPMGLLEHMINFFNCNSYTKIKCPDDYKEWLVTMYVQFGNKWSNLHLGPKWSVVPIEQATGDQSTDSTDPLDAKVNIPGLSLRYMRKLIANTAITTTAAIQTHVLDEAVKHHSEEWWWLKADGCDIVSGLAESTRGVWTGDVDFNDGALEEQYSKYNDRLNDIGDIRPTNPNLCQSLSTQYLEFKQNLVFLSQELEKAQKNYEEKLNSSTRVAEKTKFALAWKVQELHDLIDSIRKLTVEVSTLVDKLRSDVFDPIQENLARKLDVLRQQLSDAVKRLSKHQRTTATHILVFMISTESRNTQPYALPVQCLPICGIKDMAIRELCNKILEVMVERNMPVAGFTTNGEFNSLRWKGNGRPLTVLQIKSEIRSCYQRKGFKTLMAMLTPVVTADGEIVAMKQNSAVSPELLTEIWDWKQEGVTNKDILCRLRQRTVPDGYSYYFWCPGKTEDELDMIKSILAQLHYKYEVLEWDKKGVPFRSHIYVPEVNPVTDCVFHEREDEAHVLKRIAQSLRDGGPHELKVERFMEAVYSEETQLSYHALIGTRKQSVSDAEQIFSSKVLKFFESKGYTEEAKFVQVIRNWRRATDERGLSEEERRKFNQDLLSYIMDDLMPWHSELQFNDLSLLEVNRPLNDVRGFTRETLSALLVDIESREWRRMYNRANELPPEHPRASTSDDIECFFSILRDMVGKDFTHKEVMYGWRKACLELSKRLDKDLPFYYHTSTHQRFFEGERPDFSKPPAKPRKVRASRRELLTSNIGGRVSLVQRGATSIRTQFHNVPVELPPPPSMPVHMTDHTY